MSTVQVEMCGDPELRINPTNGTAKLEFLFHTTDPESQVHAELVLILDPNTGKFWFIPGWVV